jgi:putative ABC transport system substrate-binding protein
VKIFLRAICALFICVGVLSVSLVPQLSAWAATAKRTVGIISFNGNEPRYAITKSAMMDQLKKEGIDTSKIEFLYEDAAGDKEKASEAAKKMHEKADIFVALGTSAAVPASKVIQDKPIVIGMVYDPVTSKLIKDWKKSGTNVCGASNFVSIPMFMRRLVKRSEGVYPIKKIGVLYTPGEKNSELQMQAVKSVESELGIVVTPVPVTSVEDVTNWSKGLHAHSTDLVFVTGSNVIGTHIASIVNAAIAAKIWTATHLDDLVERGILLGLVAEPHEVGKIAGKALAQVLKGGTPSDMAVDYPLPRLMINKKTEQGGAFKLPAAIQQWAAANPS